MPTFRMTRSRVTSMALVTALFLLITSSLVSQSSWALKPSIEADRLLIAAEEAFDENDRASAAEHLQAARNLGIALPVEFNFLYGKLLFQQGNPNDARRYLEQYVNREGDQGRYYRDALSLITKSQGQRRASSTPSNSSGKAEITRADGSGSYVDHIQQLYASNNAASALTTHLNNLLKFYAYGSDQRIIASSRSGTPSRHKIQYSGRGEIISFNKIGASANNPFTEDRFSVFGVNPHISFECRASTSSCWLYHPITKQRWLQIVRNEDAALEISKAMSRLIKDLQKNS